MDPIVFRAVRAIPEMGIEDGDDVVFDPTSPRLFTRCSPVDPGAALNQYELGALVPLTPAPPAVVLASAVGSPSPLPQPGAKPRLVRLK